MEAKRPRDISSIDIYPIRIAGKRDNNTTTSFYYTSTDGAARGDSLNLMHYAPSIVSASGDPLTIVNKAKPLRAVVVNLTIVRGRTWLKFAEVVC